MQRVFSEDFFNIGRFYEVNCPSWESALSTFCCQTAKSLLLQTLISSPWSVWLLLLSLYKAAYSGVPLYVWIQLEKMVVTQEITISWTCLVNTSEYTSSGDCRFLANIPSWWKNQPLLVRVGGVRPPPFILLPSRTKLQCTLRLGWQIHSPYFLSSLPFS